MSYIDGLKHELVAASRRLGGPATVVAPRGRRGPLSSRALGVAVAGLVSATAIAATSGWHPLFGAPGDPQPRVLEAAPRAELMALLGVLRRPQTAPDRGPSTRAALRFFGTNTQGINAGYIRQLPAGADGLHATLVPASSSRSLTGRRVHDVVCLFVAEAAGDGGASGCYTAEQIRRGAVQGGLGSVFYALVPDGVAGVVLRDDDGMRTVEVHDNFYEDAGTRGRGPVPRRVRVVRWLDADGQPAALQPTSP